MFLTPLELTNEFDRQVNNLMQRQYSQAAGISSDDLLQLIQPLRAKLVKLTVLPKDLEQGKLPFVIVVTNELIDSEKTMSLVERDGKKGVTILRPHTSKDFKTIEKIITGFYPKAKELEPDVLSQLMPLVKTRMETLKDFENSTGIFFTPKADLETEQEKEIAKKLLENFTSIEDWQHDMIFTAMKTIMTENQIRMPLLYKIFTGQERGLPLPQVLEILGKDKTLTLLNAS